MSICIILLDKLDKVTVVTPPLSWYEWADYVKQQASREKTQRLDHSRLAFGCHKIASTATAPIRQRVAAPGFSGFTGTLVTEMGQSQGRTQTQLHEDNSSTT
jgi:hypothetical protein